MINYKTDHVRKMRMMTTYCGLTRELSSYQEAGLTVLTLCGAALETIDHIVGQAGRACWKTLWITGTSFVTFTT